ncbi:MAG: potassium channel family protein [Candidatus Binatia bacterium]
MGPARRATAAAGSRLPFLRRTIDAWRRRRFTCLFVTLILTLVAAPVLQALGRDPSLLRGFVELNLVAAVVGTVDEPGFHPLLALAGAALVTMVVSTMSGAAPLLTADQTAWSLVTLLAMASILRTVLRRGPVDSERIWGALSVYLLFGILCGVIYRLCEQAWPGSLVSAHLTAGAELTLRDTIYFSFVTLASLGYGDITPRTGPVQFMAVVEAISGQLYLVVLVAWLVSLYNRER